MKNSKLMGSRSHQSWKGSYQTILYYVNHRNASVDKCQEHARDWWAFTNWPISSLSKVYWSLKYYFRLIRFSILVGPIRAPLSVKIYNLYRLPLLFFIFFFIFLDVTQLRILLIWPILSEHTFSLTFFIFLSSSIPLHQMCRCRFGY